MIDFITTCLYAILAYSDYFGFKILFDTLAPINHTSKYPDKYLPKYIFNVILLPDDKCAISWNDTKIAYALETFNNYLTSEFLPKSNYNFYSCDDYGTVTELIYFTSLKINAFGFLTLEIVYVSNPLDKQYIDFCRF